MSRTSRRTTKGNAAPLSPPEEIAPLQDVSAPQTSDVAETSEDLAPNGIVETPAETPAQGDDTPAPDADETPEGDTDETPDADADEETPDGEGDDEDEADAPVGKRTSDGNRLRAAELLELLQIATTEDDVRDLAAEVALLVPMLIAPVSECDNCRGKIVRDTPPVVHEATCNTMITHEVARADREEALRGKVEQLPEEFRALVLDGELAKIAADYTCNCGAEDKARAATRSARSSSGGGAGVRGERKALVRMSAKLNLLPADPDGTVPTPTFTVKFPESGAQQTWTMPENAGDKAAIRAVLAEAIDFAVENGAVKPGQTNAVSKAMRFSGLYRLNS